MKKVAEKIRQDGATLVVFEHAAMQDAVDIKYLIEALKRQFGEKVDIVRVDASYNGEIKISYKLKEYPTWILYKKGEELMRESGKKNEAELAEMIQTAL